MEKFLTNLKNSWVGTDSEAIAVMLFTLLKTSRVSDQNLSMHDIIRILSPLSHNDIASLPEKSSERAKLELLMRKYRGFALDGPVSCIALIALNNDVQLLAFRDPNLFRTLQVVIDWDKNIVYVASELNQILKATGLKQHYSWIESYSPDAGEFLLVSLRSGIIEFGRRRRPSMEFPTGIEKLPHIKGDVAELAGEEIYDHRKYYGNLGFHGAYCATGPGTLEIYGDLGPRSLEAASVRKIIVHGDCSMMVGNALQSKVFYLRGEADSRFCPQLRSMKDPEPVIILGENADMYAGRMMSAGKLMVLGLGSLGSNNGQQLVGKYFMTGAVGGIGYVRGDVPSRDIGKPPLISNVLAVCDVLKDEGILTGIGYEEIKHDPLDFARVKRILPKEEYCSDPEGALGRLEILFAHCLQIERRMLNLPEINELKSYLKEFCEVFHLDASTLEKLLSSSYTVVKPFPRN